MTIEFSDSRLVVRLSDDDKMNADGFQYPTHCSLCFYDNRGGQEVTVFATRKQLVRFAKKILEANEICTNGQEET